MTPEPNPVPPPPDNSTGTRVRYNPHSESDPVLQVASCNYEMLRRSPEFRRDASLWVENKDFRLQFIRERKVYKNNGLARCALDWMLTPEQRYELAKIQIQDRLFFSDLAANYGPIIVKHRLQALNARLRDCIDNLFDVAPDPEPGGFLTCDQAWPVTPQKFRDQFSAPFFEEVLKELNFDSMGREIARLGNYLLSGKPLRPEDQLALGRYLLQRGDRLRRLSRDSIVCAIRRHGFYSERIVDDTLQRIKARLPHDPKTGHDRDTKRSFLGTVDQWDKFLAWEANGRNAYRAAGEFLSKLPPKPMKGKHHSSHTPRSERQRDTTASIRHAVKAIKQWFPKIYPIRNLEPSSLRKPR